MANEKRLIDANAFRDFWNKNYRHQYANDNFLVAIANFPTVDAVEVNRLGKLGRLMMPYKGDPRGHMGARGCSGEDFRAIELDPITDVDGNRWIPVLEEDLCAMKARADDTVKVAHGRWLAVTSSDMMTGKAYKCSECNKMRYGSFMPNYCSNCGAKMDGDGNG